MVGPERRELPQLLHFDASWLSSKVIWGEAPKGPRIQVVKTPKKTKKTSTRP